MRGKKKGSRWNIFISVQVNNFPLDLRKAGKSLGPIRRAFYWPQSRKSQHILHYWDRDQESVWEGETDRTYGRASYDKSLRREWRGDKGIRKESKEESKRSASGDDQQTKEEGGDKQGEWQTQSKRDRRMRVCFNPCSAGVSLAGLSPVLLSSALFHVHNYGMLSIISKTVLLGRCKITDLSTSANRININISLLIYSHSHPKYLNEPWQRENAFVTTEGKQRRTNGGRKTDRDEKRRCEKQNLKRFVSRKWMKRTKGLVIQVSLI